MLEKLKSFLSDDALYFAILLILVGIISFGLGQRSVLGKGEVGPAPKVPAGVTLTEASKEQKILNNNLVQVLGSRSGTKYHLPNCPGASQIKEENKVYFDSYELAKAAGYTPAANCPGLE